MDRKKLMEVLMVILLILLIIPIFIRYLIFGSEYYIEDSAMYNAICAILILLQVILAIFCDLQPNTILLLLITICSFSLPDYMGPEHIARGLNMMIGLMQIVLCIIVMKQKKYFVKLLGAVACLFSVIFIILSSVGLLLSEKQKWVYYSPGRTYRAEVLISSVGDFPTDTTVNIYNNDSKEIRLLFGRVVKQPIIQEYVYTLNEAYDSAFVWTDETHFMVFDDTVSVIGDNR